MNEYLKKVDDAARDALRKIVEADNELNRAEKLMSEANSTHDERRIVNAKGYLLDAQDGVRAARKYATNALDNVQGERMKAIQAAVTASTVNPDEVDAAAMELLKSGIMRPADYDSMVRRYASNKTMTRLIARYCEDAAANEKNESARALFSTIATTARENVNPERAADGMDIVLDTFARCINNHKMIPKYNELTCPVTGYRPQE